MPQSNISKRAERRNAVAKLRNGQCTYREAAGKYNIPKSTLYDLVRRSRNPTVPKPRTALNDKEEALILKTLQYHANNGVSLTRHQLIETARCLIQSLPEPRRKSLPFRNDTPGIRWVRSFEKRHKDYVTFVVPARSELKRDAAGSVETSTKTVDSENDAAKVNKT